MSNHPFGLRGDPFASPATLSAKDASRLIRRRVRAFNGDGGALFPIDTCDLIHELAGGVPDAMLALAGAGLRNAAEEGATAVSPAHVRKAVEQAPDVAGAAPAIAPETPAPPDPGTERAARAIDALIEAADEAERESLPETVDDGGPVESEEAPVAWADDDDDLPPFQPAAFALPSRPSENLDPNARDWVSRFISTSATDTAARETVRVSSARTQHEATAETTAPPASRSGPRSPAAERAPAPAYASPPRRRKPRSHAPRRRRRSGGPGILIAVAALCIIAFVVRMSTRGSLVLPGGGPERPTPTSAPAVERRADADEPRPAASSAREPAATDASTAARTDPTNPPATLESVPVLRPAVPRTSTPEPASASASVTGSVEPSVRPAPSRKFGLEVATFIFEERARVERERLADIGLRARVVTTLEYGSRVYRVVLGGYPDPAAAERAADSLLSNGVVLQARVVSVSY
jgi:sporulation related protein